VSGTAKTALYNRAKNIARSFLRKDDVEPRLSYYSGSFEKFMWMMWRVDLYERDDLITMNQEFRKLDYEIVEYLKLVKKSRKPARTAARKALAESRILK
jgi:hypothetical protein